MIPEALECETRDGMVRFSLDGMSTGWMDRDDSFIRRIDEDCLNSKCPLRHLKKEIQIRNVLDEGNLLLKSFKFQRAIGKFDSVLFYDGEYGEALLGKSRCLHGQKHFVKALRYYKRAVKADSSLEDVDYYKTLLSEANHERDAFPKLKRNIYMGDEHFSKGEYEKAIESYDRALNDPSGFKQKILPKLLMKKATAYLKLDDYEDALDCFTQSLDVKRNDYAVFGKGLCEYNLNIPLSDDFRGCLRISKSQMLEQALILNDLEFFTESLKICSFLLENHFTEDEFYLRLADARGHAKACLH